jgi:hypothetical protein
MDHPGYRANLRILELLGAHSNETFRLVMLTLKRWASGHFIAGGQFGMLNGTTLTLMFVHIFLQHPEETAPALLAHFFDVYSRWFAFCIESAELSHNPDRIIIITLAELYVILTTKELAHPR